MAFNKNDEASFCKILLSDSEEYLPVPLAFANKHLITANNKNKKQTIVLEPSSAATDWTVTFLQLEDRCYFLNGWPQFVKDNRLQVGDVLVFWLCSSLSSSSNPKFQVFIYAPDGCLKHPTQSESSECDYLWD